MFDHINQHQEKLFNLSKVILIVVALLMSITVIYFMFFYKSNEITKSSVSKAQVESVDLVSEP